MSRLAISAFCLLLPLAPSTHAQSSDQAMQDFRAQVLNQPLTLQSFSADPVTNYVWTATGLSTSTPKLRTLGVFTFSSVKLHKDDLLLTGTRSIATKDKNGQPALLGATRVSVKIALKGIDPAQVLPALKQQLFFPNLATAPAAVPVEYQRLLSTDRASSVLSNPNCSALGTHYERPNVTHSQPPQFSEEARRARFSGSVTIILTVDENGHASDLWLKSPAGLGLDEQVVKAVSDSTFKPATCDGTTVKTPLAVDISFATL